MALEVLVVDDEADIRDLVSGVLEDEGYIHGFARENVSKGRDELVIQLKYHEGEAVIKEIKRISTPGRRVYRTLRIPESVALRVHRKMRRD